MRGDGFTKQCLLDSCLVGIFLLQEFDFFWFAKAGNFFLVWDF
jgi:hypothetical protein